MNLYDTQGSKDESNIVLYAEITADIINTNLIKIRGWIRVVQKGRWIMFHK